MFPPPEMMPPSAMPPQGPPQPPQADPEKEFIKKNGEQLRRLVEVNCREAIDREKILQYAVCRRNDFYYRGNQHLVPTFSGGGEVVDFRPVNGQMSLASGKGDLRQSVIYDYVVNTFRGDIRKFVGVLGNKSPNAKARPSWASDETGIRRSDLANESAGYLRSQWDVDAANRAVALSLAKNGTTFIYTHYTADPDRYGTFDEPVWGTKPEKISPDGYGCLMCGTNTPGDQMNPPARCSNPSCMQPLGPQDFVPGETQDVPAITGQKTYPNGTVELSIHSPYDVTTPFYIKDLEHCPWLWLEYEDDAAYLASQFPGNGLEEQIGKDATDVEALGTNSSTLGRLAREQASSPTGYTNFQRPNRWVYSRFWIRPSMYLYLLKDGQAMSAKGMVDDLKKQFPRGMKLSFVNKKLVKVEHERLDEVWSAVKPETSEYIYADPIFNDYIQISDIANDAVNIEIQLMETSIPAIIYDTNVLSPNKIKKGFQPNEFVPSSVPGQMLDKAFWKIPTSDPRPEIMEFVKEYIATAREIIGLLPAIWGGDGVPNETAEAARRRLNQALMVLSTTWNEIRGGWARAYRNGVRQLARYSMGRLVSSQGDPESVTVKELGDLQDLLQGGWEFECDQAIPMSWTQLRDFVQSLFTMAPEVASMLGANDPENLEEINEGIGVVGWKIPGLDELHATHDLIGRLMKEAPIPGPTGNMPSIQLDFQVTWNPQSTMKIIHDWLMSQEGRAAEGQPGYANVIAAGMAALQAMAPPPMDPAAPSGSSPTPKQGAILPGGDAPTLPESLPGANAPTQPEAPLPPLPQQTGLLNQPPQGAVQ